MTTEPFVVSSNLWRISWRANGGGPGSVIEIYLRGSDGSRVVLRSVDSFGAPLYMQTSGTYSFEVIVQNASLVITVEEGR